MRLLIAVVLLLTAPWPSSAQPLAPVSPASPVATLSAAEMEKFLLDGRIVKKKESSKGVTSAYRVTLSDGALTHDAQVQNVDIAKPYFDVGPKKSEVNFKDSYRYNVAAYRLAVLLGLDNVPMSVERNVEGKAAAMTWWLDGVMDDGDRRKKKIPQSNPARAADYYNVMFVFDELIQNRDRNQGNLLWTKDWTLWLIDHTRAFRLGRELMKPEQLTRCDRALLQALRGLTFEGMNKAMGEVMSKDEMNAVLFRRDLIVKHFDDRVARLGEAVVLFTM